MRYITSPDKDGIQFGDYLDALADYRDQLPSEVAEFAGDEDRFVLNHEKSLHDAWLEEVRIIESRSTDSKPSEVSIQLILLGQMHDRKIIINYQGVTNHLFSGARTNCNFHDTFHGDIFTHEVRLSEEGMVQHEILFDEVTRFEVTCQTFSVEDQINQTG